MTFQTWAGEFGLVRTEKNRVTEKSERSYLVGVSNVPANSVAYGEQGNFFSRIVSDLVPRFDIPQLVPHGK